MLFHFQIELVYSHLNVIRQELPLVKAKHVDKRQYKVIGSAKFSIDNGTLFPDEHVILVIELPKVQYFFPVLS